MAAQIKSTEVNWHDPVRLQFGFYGLSAAHSIPIIRELIQDSWPEIRRERQCVYVVRLHGAVSIAYGEQHSPVIYIGEGNAYYRLYSHAYSISSLLVSVPNTEVEIHIAEIARKNNGLLYKYIEADMIKWFFDEFGCLPWFNQQRESSKESHYQYEADAAQKLTKHIGVGSGNKFLWAIRPLPNNDQYKPYGKGASMSYPSP
jgi:hypothetical protein